MDEGHISPLTPHPSPLTLMSHPEIHIIVAMTKNRVIGMDNNIPWHIPEDLHHFKTTTMGHGLIMGRKTWESIGKPLPGRSNIILSRTTDYTAHGCHHATSLAEAISYAATIHKKIFIIGGGQIYQQALTLAHAIHITLLHRNIQGDIFFPHLPKDIFSLQTETEHQWREPVTLQHFSRNK